MGIFMLIVLPSGNGLIHAFEESSSERAMNSIKILIRQFTTKSYDGLKEGRFIRLDNKDLNATSEHFPTM